MGLFFSLDLLGYALMSLATFFAGLTPFDMRVLNRLDRFDLVMSAVYNLPQLGNRGAYLIQQMKDKLIEHKQYIAEHGLDLPEVAEWKWSD